MWVCSEQTCMFFKTVKTATPAQAIDVAPDPESQGQAPLVPEDWSVSSFGVDEQEPQEAVQPMDLPVQEFWDSIRCRKT